MRDHHNKLRLGLEGVIEKHGTSNNFYRPGGNVEGDKFWDKKTGGSIEQKKYMPELKWEKSLNFVREA